VEHVRHTFFCRADDVFEKTVEQSRFEQMHFEQLTLTQAKLLVKIKMKDETTFLKI
jgi:hypothetical protein